MTIPKTAGLCMVRDSLDIVPLLCGHYLRVGFERIHFLDDGSSDGTFEFLSRLSRKTERVTVERRLGDLNQAERMTEAANALIQSGFRVIFPFDADEFWNLSVSKLRQLAALEMPRIIEGYWTNFVQSRHLEYPRPMGLLSVRFRAQPIPGVGMSEIIAFRQPFVSIDGIKKIALWTNEPVRIGMGQHSCQSGVTGAPRVPLGAEAWDRKYEIFHLPLRYRSELTKRALNYEPRWATSRPDASISWQSYFHRRIVLDGKSEEVWKANSVDSKGCLNVYGKPRKLCRDGRLRSLLLLSAIYMVCRFGMFVL